MVPSQFGSRARAFFDRAFPERQIYHRSGGTVRYVSLSPGKQALLALSAVGLAGWCVYATANTVLAGSQVTASNNEIERERAKYDRWLNESRRQVWFITPIAECNMPATNTWLFSRSMG